MSHYALVQLRVGEVSTEKVRRTRVAGFTTSSSYVPASGRRPDVMVSATRLDERVDVQTIEHLDWDASLPCEHGQHPTKHDDEPAKYVVLTICPGCHGRGTYLLCASGWVRLMRSGATACTGCGHMCRAAEAMTIVQVLT